MIELDVAKRKLQLLVSDAGDRASEGRAGRSPSRRCARGYWKLYFDHVNQADEGADLDFLVGKSRPFVPRDNH